MVTATPTDVISGTATPAPIATAGVQSMQWVTSGGFDVGVHLAWGLLGLATLVAFLLGVLLFTMSPMGRWGR